MIAQIGYKQPDVAWNGLTVTDLFCGGGMNHDILRSAPLKLGSLFSGYGGLDLAVEQFFGAKTVWHCEWDDGPSKILAAHWPGVPNHRDVSKVDWSAVERVDILTGGFPCQDVSAAGRRNGLMEGTRSGLFHEFVRAIEQLKPSIVVIENVRGLFSAPGEPKHPELLAAEAEVKRIDRVLQLIKTRIRKHSRDTKYVARKRGESVRITRQRGGAVARCDYERGLVQRAFATVLKELAYLGFDAEWRSVRASDVGAPHQRFRVFIVAYSRDAGSFRGRAWRKSVAGEEARGRPFGESFGSGGVGFSEAVEHTFRTPAAAEAEGGLRNPDREGATMRLSDQVHEAKFPTPNTVEPLPVREGEARERQLRRGEGPDASRRASMGNLREDVTFLPTVAANDSGNTPKQHLAKKPGRTEVTSLQVVTEYLMPTLPTPRRHDFQATMGALGEVIGISNFKKLDVVAEYETLWDSLEDQSPFWKTVEGKDYWPAIRRWAVVMGRPSPSPTIPDGKDSRHRLNPRFTEWLMGQADGWITSPSIGLTRNEQLKACGNGVVTQQAVYALSLAWPFVLEAWGFGA